MESTYEFNSLGLPTCLKAGEIDPVFCQQDKIHHIVQALIPVQAAILESLSVKDIIVMSFFCSEKI